MDQVALYFRGEPEIYFYTFTEQADSGRDIMEDLRRFQATLYAGKKERVPGTAREWRTRWKPQPRAKAFGVKEFTKRGVRHVHMIATFKMDNEELTQRWRLATKGVSDQARITESFNLHSPAGYMMKYMAKQLDQDLEQFYTGEFQFKKHERRTFFWKPEGIDNIPTMEIPRELQDPDQEIEIELGHHWNEQSKYWRSWYDSLYNRWGEPFHRYMEYSTLSTIQQARIAGVVIEGEINFDYVPEQIERDQDRELLIKAHKILKEKSDLTRVKWQTEAVSWKERLSIQPLE